MTTPTPTTVEADSEDGQVDPADAETIMEKYPEYLRRYQVYDAAVLVTEKGAISVTGQVGNVGEDRLKMGLPWIKWKTINVRNTDA